MFSRHSTVLAALAFAATAVLPLSSAEATAPTVEQSTAQRAGAAGLARAEVLQRADFWFDRAVPYSQARSSADPQGVRYRTDSSGYASMVWRLPQSLTTHSLPSVSHRITKDELRPGDVLLNPEEHVVVFAGWADQQRTRYVAYEQTPPSVQRHTLPYPYYGHNNAYLPYRYDHIK
ncbi:hypothetical protein ACYBSK_18950 [Streptomyces sp. BYX5S]